MSNQAIGIVLLTVVAIAWGGSFLLRVVSGKVRTNELQRAYFRAGHAHAGVLVILGLVVQLLLRDQGVPGWAEALASGVLVGAILMPLGFFLSVLGEDPKEPNAMRWSIVAGGVAVVLGVIGAGVGLIAAA
ncbi:hypothetical protein LKO27_04515 [Tessaracoccus sp. OS52]|uniref:hypothetical protein n=1 Tax=Tessaracoccus sp. OS52 TaxID=2886691 RepID=UPI001D119F9D|nr:hypothetical protein [Tessaracoccus sp. OS52]MCC2592680.1 hypothetical protein [Tessaracoccus sp. OS52]